jgi:hypothetical protein
MTDPTVPVSDVATSASSAAASALIQNADRLGLKWDLKPATVSQVDPVVTVVYDGDMTPITAVSMIGNVSIDQRVYVIFVPPSGNFIVGTTSVSNGPMGVIAWARRSAPKTGLGATETGVELLDSFFLPVNRFYSVHTESLYIASTLNEAAFYRVRLRFTTDGSTPSTTSTLGSIWEDTSFSGSGEGAAYGEFFLTPTTPNFLSVLLTFQRITGAGTFTVAGLGAANGPTIVVEDLGALLINTGVDQ